MILPIILLALIVLLLAILITFLYYILMPSIKNMDKMEDPVISKEEISTIDYEPTPVEITGKRAVVLCSCGKKFKLDPITFHEEYTCFMIKNIYNSGSDCKYACIGLGDCAKVCPQQAISIENRTAIISDLCIGCGKCEEICPQQIISLVSNKTDKMVLCKNTESNQFTSCDKKNLEEKVQWNPKKDFKIWSYCYKLIKRNK